MLSIKNEKTADEMFEELGYEIAEKNKDDEYDNICFEKEDYADVLYDKKFIIFWLEGINEISCYGLENEKTITMQELVAINKKVQELRLERINIMEDEIKVGEYVRTENGEIHKIEDIEDLRIHIETEKVMFRSWVEDYYGCHKENRFIVKHSKNIIDLIEVRRLCKWR